jgi:2-dehydro-3-deoxyphosphooctonate aldolase (KDO 8-P synthase)
MQVFLKELFRTQQFDEKNFFLIAGPCVIENEEILDEVAEKVYRICQNMGIPFVFKSSYRKANRTSSKSFTGLGDETGLELLKKIGQRYQLPTTTDIHGADEAAMAAPYADILQIPAFLCRQSDLLKAAGETGKLVNIKKGQFVSGEAMKFAVDKVRNTGNNQVMLTERGTTFGYQDLIVDYRNLPIMASQGVPVIMDCTHSLQQPNQVSGVTGGNPEMIGTIAKAAIATGADGLFIETHPDPSKALSDGANMLKLDRLEALLESLVRIRKAVL